MRLSQRQYDILKHLIENRDHFVSSRNLSVLFNVSTRTIKNELPVLREYTDPYSSFTLLAVHGKGIIIRVEDGNTFQYETQELLNQNHVMSDNDDSKRNMQILKFLLERKTYISKDRILSNFHISESTFYSSYNKIKKMIENFNLTLKHTKTKGYFIDGLEQDKRTIIAHFELFTRAHSLLRHKSTDIAHIYSFIAETFIQFKYKITESVLQNISFHVFLIKQRVDNGNTIETIESQGLDTLIEYRIAETILEKLIKTPALSENSLKKETLLLTQIILGKLNYSADETLQQEINSFISDCFKQIHMKFGFNFESVERLRLYLVLHIVPLIYRISSGTQLKNSMTTKIMQQFPHAYDISLYFSILFKEHFGYAMSLDEITYLTLYFNLGIEEMNLFKSTKRLLIITNMRHSETVLIRHKFLSWFPQQISEIVFSHSNDSLDNLGSFDAIFATDIPEDSKYQSIATKINIFPDNADYKRIDLALNGFSSNSTELILEKFNRNCFYYGKADSKAHIIRILCENAQKTFHLDHDFYEKIMSRESISSTYFGDLVAMPHPLTPISDETFISVGILDTPIKWDSQYHVQLIILLSIEKNNPWAFQLWDYIGHIIRDLDAVNRLIHTRTFDEFISSVETLITHTNG